MNKYLGSLRNTMGQSIEYLRNIIGQSIGWISKKCNREILHVLPHRITPLYFQEIQMAVLWSLTDVTNEASEACTNCNVLS